MGCQNSVPMTLKQEDFDETSLSSYEQNTPHDNMFRERPHDFFSIYEIVGRLGEGSISRVWKIKKISSAIGGSSRREYVRQQRRSQRKRQNSKNVSRMRSRSYPTLDWNKLEGAPEMFFAAKEMKPHLNEIDSLKQEIELLKRLDSPNIIRAYEVFEIRDNKIVIVLELCEGGDLYSRAPYSEQEAARIVRQIIKAVNHLHKNNIVHRDLKMENIMFSSNDPDCEVKVIDFGLSVKYVVDDVFEDRVGTLYCMSPEALQGNYTSKTDLWSVGVITYILMSGGKKPFGELEADGGNPKDVLKNILRANYEFDGDQWSQVSDSAKDFIDKLLQTDPNLRMSASEALDHPWLDLNHQHYSSMKLDQRSIIKAKSSMIKYSKSENDLYKLGMNAIAKKSTPAEVGNLHDIFHMFDTGHDGFLTLGEFKAAMGYLNFSDEEIEEIFKSLDVNENNVITYTEFLASTLQSKGKIKEYHIREAFDWFDADDSGYITHANLRQILGKNYNNSKVNRLIRSVDTDGDGRISYEEFKSVFTSTDDDHSSEFLTSFLHQAGTVSSETGRYAY